MRGLWKLVASLSIASLCIPFAWAALPPPVLAPLPGYSPEPASSDLPYGNNSTEDPDNETKEDNGNHGNKTEDPDNKTKDDHGNGKGSNESQDRGLDLTPEFQSQSVLPGRSALHRFFVTNTGDGQEDVVLSFQEGCGSGWRITLSSQGFELDKRENESFVLNVTTPLIPVSNDDDNITTELGCVVRVRAESAAHPRVWDEAIARTIILFP